MKYEGKLYGKASGEYFPLIESSEDFEQMKSELESVKAERDELKAFVIDFWEIQKDNYGNATNTHLKMIDLAGKAQELLKAKQ